MRVDSDKVTDTISNVLSSLISGGFDIVNNNSSAKDVAVAALTDTVGGVSEAIDFTSDTGALADVKNGIYSIVYAGLTSGLEGVECADGDFAAVLDATKEATLSKGKEVLPGILCDRIQAQVSSTFSNRYAAIEEKTYKSAMQKNAAVFLTDSAETLANQGMANLQGVLSGEMTAGEAIESSFTGAVGEISDKAIDSAVSKAIDKIGIGNYVSSYEVVDTAKQLISGDVTLSEVAEQKATELSTRAIDGAVSKAIDKIGIGDYVSSSEVVGTAKGLISGEVSLSEVIEQKTSELSESAINGAINKACDKLGISKYLDPQELMSTAQNVKDCFIEYINGEITETQFFLKIGQDGLYQVAQAWGTSIGTSIVLSTGMQGIAAAITAAASSTIITAVYSELYKYALNVFEEEIASEQRLNAIKALSAEAIDVIKSEREFLLKSTFIQAEKRQRVFNESLNSLVVALDTNDVDLLTSALNAITAEVGGTIQFKTFEEFDDFMLDDSLALEF